jgi:hypothetical protein
MTESVTRHRGGERQGRIIGSAGAPSATSERTRTSGVLLVDGGLSADAHSLPWRTSPTSPPASTPTCSPRSSALPQLPPAGPPSHPITSEGSHRHDRDDHLRLRHRITRHGRADLPAGLLRHRREPLCRGSREATRASCTQGVDDDLLVIETSWPGTTIDGDPRIVSGMLSASRAASGEFLLNLPAGPPDGAPEDFTYLEFPSASDDARALRGALH